MASNVLSVKVSTICEQKLFSIMTHEGTDVSNIKQFSFCIRSVDENLDMSENFTGFHELENIKSEIIVNAIKNILLRCHLNLDDSHGHPCEGANNMMGKQSGVSIQILAE